MTHLTAPGAQQRLLRATGLMASGTLVSRVLGFVRAMLVAFALGNMTAQGDAFTLATVVPNNLYVLLAGGMFSSILVPEIVRHVRADVDQGEGYVNRIVTAFGLALVMVTVLATVFTPQVMSLWMGPAWQAPGLAAQRSSLLLMAYLTMPQVFFFGMFFLLGQVLNAREDFRPAAWAPALNNVVQIVVLGLYAAIWAGQADHSVPFTLAQSLLLGIGSTVGIVVQTFALLPAWRRLGFTFHPRLDLAGSGLRATFHLAKWSIGATVLLQLASLVVTRLAGAATIADPGSPGPGLLAYNAAYLTWLLPHSLITVSLATAMLPAASRLAAAADLGGVASDVDRSLRLALTFAMPAAIGFLVLADPYASLVFGNGAGASDWRAVSVTLACLALGLLPFTIQYVYFRGFYAVQQLRPVFVLQAATSVTNIAVAMAWVAVDPDPATIAPRLAIAYGVSYLVGAVLTALTLTRRLPGLAVTGIVQHMARTTLAVLPGGLVAWGITVVVADRGKLAVALGFLAAGALLVGSYLLLARRLGIGEVDEVIGTLRGRFGRPRPSAEESDDAAFVIESELGIEDPALAPLLALPDVQDASAALEASPDDIAHADDLVDGRLRLDRLLHRRPGELTWLAHDESLPRPALVLLLPAAEPGSAAVLEAAREASGVTDERLVRIVDSRAVAGRPYSGYVQYEYAPAQSLELILRQGHLNQLEACWLVREVAEALIAVHARDLYHRRLSPDTVFVTTSGDVKIAGFGVERALFPRVDDTTPGESVDVTALGRLLYAALLCRWPAGPAFGLPGATTDTRGRPFSPDAVTAGIAREVADIADRIISPSLSRYPALTTAVAVTEALGGVLGSANASDALSHRSRRPSPSTAVAWSDAPTPVPPPPGTPVPAEALPVTSGWQPRSRAALPGDGPTDEPGAGAPGDGDADATVAMQMEELDADVGGQPTPAEDEPHAPAPSERRLLVKVLASLFGLALLVGIAGVFINTAGLRPAPDAPKQLVIAGVRDFDPAGDGGDDAENPAQARLAIDGQTDTVWSTETYGRSANFNGRKPGVGLLLDLGTPQQVGSVVVTVVGGPTDVDVRVPKGDTSVAPMGSEADWRTVADSPGGSGTLTIVLAEKVTTRYVLVYVTSLPEVASGPGYQGGIAEVSVTG